MVAEFKELVQKSPVTFDEAAWQKDLTFIKAMIRYEIDVDLFGVAAASQNLAKHDPQLQFALTLFPEAQQLLRARAVRRRATARRGKLASVQLPTSQLADCRWDGLRRSASRLAQNIVV